MTNRSFGAAANVSAFMQAGFLEKRFTWSLARINGRKRQRTSIVIGRHNRSRSCVVAIHTASFKTANARLTSAANYKTDSQPNGIRGPRLRILERRGSSGKTPPPMDCVNANTRLTPGTRSETCEPDWAAQAMAAVNDRFALPGGTSPRRQRTGAIPSPPARSSRPANGPAPRLPG